MDMYCSMTQDELRVVAKNAIENFELWARRLIDIKLVAQYGTAWYDHVENGNPLINSKFNARIKSMLAKDPLRCPRAVDTLFIEDIVYLLCRQDLYTAFFQPAMAGAFPQGKDEANEFLSRLVPIRNKLNHANHISVREAEKAICYSNDFIDSLKKYYKEVGAEQVYNVPLVVKITDSLGNQFIDSQIFRNSTGRGHCRPAAPLDVITIGEPFTIEAEVDPSFDESTYSVAWLFENTWHEGRKFTATLNEHNVKINFTLYCRVISNQHAWHRCGDVDDSVSVTYKVIPPMH